MYTIKSHACPSPSSPHERKREGLEPLIEVQQLRTGTSLFKFQMRHETNLPPDLCLFFIPQALIPLCSTTAPTSLLNLGIFVNRRPTVAERHRRTHVKPTSRFESSPLSATRGPSHWLSIQGTCIKLGCCISPQTTFIQTLSPLSKPAQTHAQTPPCAEKDGIDHS